MRIAQIVLAGASLYERKSQRLDAVALAATHEVELVTVEGPATADGPRSVAARLDGRTRGFDIAHVYGPRVLPRLRFGLPYIATGTMPRRWWAPHVPPPLYAVAPVEDASFTLLPEAVDDAFFDVTGSGTVIGVVLRPSVKNVIEQTMHRLARTRDDIIWHLFDGPPAPEEMAEIAVWIDPALDRKDGRDVGDEYDGFTAEALAAGRVVVASRTAINLQRTEKGRTATLVPQNDPNELTHAILSGLFKPEAVQQRVTAARQTISKFRVRQRLRVLAHLYGTLLR